MIYGKIFKELREEKNLSQQELAAAINVTQASISFWESNKRTPNIDDCIKMANFFDISLDELVGRERKNNFYVDQRQNNGTINNNF